ncbi:MAG: crotonase/enoyl-CoA hydratase family protein [Solirubrobacterales bacterium]|nr:crotonase/enoyl-CoA hydratase family protein [Solirubrobacterales bacterium]
MADLTSYALDGGIATITMDDGKVNALSVDLLGSISHAFDRAAADEAVVVLTGRASTFSAGFDLRAQDWQAMVGAGGRLAEKLLSHPHPVVAACNGNAIAMGAFLLLSADLRIGVAGEHKLGLNEVAIGMTLPWFGIELARHRLARPWFDRCTITGALLDPEQAREAGFLDTLVAPEELAAAAQSAAHDLLRVDRKAHAATKLRVRERVLAGVRAGAERIERGDQEW